VALEVGGGGRFTVKSCYSKLERILVLEEGSVSVNRVLGVIWKSLAPLKVVVFSWRVFLDCIPTRDNLRRRNIFSGWITCTCLL
jgi:hypothetical protein